MAEASHKPIRRPGDSVGAYELPPANAFTKCRRLMAHLGLISWGDTHGLRLLRKSDRLIRELKNVDKGGVVREQHKVAVVYLGPGQESKDAAMLNTGGSAAYRAFVSGLGWPVLLEQHQGYSGRLPAEQFPGTTLPYYATPTLEMIFHVATDLDPAGAQAAAAAAAAGGGSEGGSEARHALVHKRWVHVGNDDVHIIWSEHGRAFHPSHLPTKFGELSIVIHPLHEPGLFGIRLLSKEPELLSAVGPLFDGAVVGAAVLAALVRETAVQAGRALRQRLPGYRPFYVMRREYLDKIISTLDVPLDFEDFTCALIAPRALPTARASILTRGSNGPGAGGLAAGAGLGAGGGAAGGGDPASSSGIGGSSSSIGGSPALHHHLDLAMPASSSPETQRRASVNQASSVVGAVATPLMERRGSRAGLADSGSSSGGRLRRTSGSSEDAAVYGGGGASGGRGEAAEDTSPMRPRSKSSPWLLT